MIHRLFAAGLTLSLVTACATTDPYTRETEASKASKGAAIGAGVAAVVAAVDNRDEDARTRNQRVLKSAAAGAAIGGGIGYYMDLQEAKLREQLENTGVSVMREGNNLTLVMPGHITFATDSADLRDEFGEILHSVALVLTEFDKTHIEVSGHTDNTGTDRYNQLLSERRAETVAAALRDKGVESSRVLTRGFGESRPVADNGTESGRRQNRRVELELIPMEQ